MKIRIKNHDTERDIGFPCSENNLYSALSEVHSIDKDPMPVAVIEVDEPKELGVLIGQSVDLDEINYLAKRMDSFDEKEMFQFLESVNHTGLKTPKDLINLTFNLDKFTLIQDISDMADVGWTYQLNTDGALPSNDRGNPIYAEIGWKMLTSGKGIFTEHGLLFVSETPIEEVYDGSVFPTYDYCFTLMSAKIDYNGKQETIYLPDEDLAIIKAAKRLGAQSIEDCTIDIYACSVDASWMDRIQDIINTEGIFSANHLLQSLNDSEVDLDMLSAIVESVGTKKASNIAILANHIDQFGFINDIDSMGEVGHYFVDNDDDYSLHPDMEDFFNFSEFGEYITEEKEGTFVSGGFVYYDGQDCLNYILNQFEDEGEGFCMGIE